MTTLIAAVVIVVFVTIFSIQNAAPVAISFLFWKFGASLAVAIFLSALCGLILGVIVTYVIMEKKRRRSARETFK
ncbi:MAG: LapA family protein [Syntrophobacterales bacterium]|jgi:uncharacterized integral membrane protein|nr:LapA family protein [Syntrophobacterales bacterium]